MPRHPGYAGFLVVFTLTMPLQAAAQSLESPIQATGLDDSAESVPDLQFIWRVPRRNLPSPFRTTRPLRRPAAPEITPAWEVAAQTGLWNLMRSGFAGGRVSRNFASWIGAELFMDGRRATDTDPAYRLLGVNARFVKRFHTRDGTPYSAFLTTGVGGTLGLGYRYSPMIGAGAQTAWRGRVGLRAEIQKFKRGTTINNSARVVMGAAVGFGK